MKQLGGDAVVLTPTEMQIGRGETLADTARVLSRYVDAMMIRIIDAERLRELARHATVPVINGLTEPLAPVPAPRRRDDVRGASRADQGPHRRLVGRRQQHDDDLDPGGGAVSIRAAPRLSRRGSTRRTECPGLGEGARRRRFRVD